MSVGPLRRAREEIAGITAILVTGIWLAALVSGFEWWLPFMLFGYVVLVPLVALLFGEEEEAERGSAVERDVETPDERRPTDPSELDNALVTLRERYARGELTDAQFERKLDRLLDTETIEAVEDRRRESMEESESA